MKRVEKINRVEIIEHIECDICGKQAWQKCVNCKKDICWGHLKCEDGYLDYPDYYCPECYPKYRVYMDTIRPKFEKMMNEAYEEAMKGDNV